VTEECVKYNLTGIYSFRYFYY